MFNPRNFCQSNTYCNLLVCEFFGITVEECSKIVRSKLYILDENGKERFNSNKFVEVRNIFEADIETVEKVIMDDSDREEQILFFHHFPEYGIKNLDKTVLGRWNTSDNKYLKFAGYICTIFESFSWNQYERYVREHVFEKGILKNNPKFSEEQIYKTLELITAELDTTLSIKSNTMLLNTLLAYNEIIPDTIRFKYDKKYLNENFKETTPYVAKIAEEIDTINEFIMNKLVCYNDPDEPYAATNEYIRKFSRTQVFPYKILENQNIIHNPANIDLSKEYYVYFGYGFYGKAIVNANSYIRRINNFPNSYRVNHYDIHGLYMIPTDVPTMEDGTVEMYELNINTNGIISDYLDEDDYYSYFEDNMFDYLDGSNDNIGVHTGSTLVISDTLEDAKAFYNYSKSIRGESSNV